MRLLYHVYRWLSTAVYFTLPAAQESPVNYWLRLNMVAEVASRHLAQQGSRMENMDAEIMMFSRNCPDDDLSSVFKCKSIGKWTVVEVQEAIDENQKEAQWTTPRSLTVVWVSMVEHSVLQPSKARPK